MTVRGFEIDSTALVATGFSLRANVAYADGRYDSYPNGPCPIERIGTATTFCDLSGLPLSSLPKWSITAGGDYEHPIGGAGSGFAHADANKRTSQFGEPSDSAYTIIKGYTVVTASIGYRSKQRYEIVLFVRNLFDVIYIQNVPIQAGNSGLTLGTPSDPRTFDITFRAHQ